ncbi:MAG TPA: hypothetical protein VN181_09460 [Thermoanaerobaculia bacterium]|nr:hypothetical protein [Thermoanaerobaculia bacterium]
MTFAVHDCGFTARSALEHDDAGESRYNKILRIIRACRFGIHDISRVELDRSTRLPRFNMPLELGLFLGARSFGASRDRMKRCLVLEREPYRYQSFCSDIAGQDIRAHGGEPETAVRIVRDWLSISTTREVIVPSGSIIVRRYRAYQRELPDWCKRQQLVPNELTFKDETRLIALWLKANPWSTAV